MPCQQSNSGMAERKLVSLGFCEWQSPDASDSCDTILDVESMRLYKKCDTEVIATSYLKFDNAITTKNNK